MENKTGISVIICCYNSSSRIEETLKHVQKQEKMQDISWEVILVDNASKDNTVEVAEKTWVREDVSFKIVYEKNPGLSNARKKGIESSAFPYFVFVDDDNWLAIDYISRAFRIMEDHQDVGMAGGYGVPITSVELPDWFKEFEAAFAVGHQYQKEGYVPYERTYLHGAGMIMRRSAWDTLENNFFRFVLSDRKGGALSSGGDSELTYAIRLAGYSCWYDPNLKFKHLIPENRISWQYLLNLASEFGKSFVILNIYSTELRNYVGWKRSKSHSWLLGFAIALYQFLKFFPGVFKDLNSDKEGSLREFQYYFKVGELKKRMSIILQFSKIKNEISSLKYRLQAS